MIKRFDFSDEFLFDESQLEPSNAAVAIILDDNRRFLLQLRDNKSGIFFPNHWGFFGGALEENETPQQCLVRELSEELGLFVQTSRLTYVLKLDLCFKLNASPVVRHFFVLEMYKDEMHAISINEGQEGTFFSSEECLRIPNFAPYDRFAIWAFLNEERVVTKKL